MELFQNQLMEKYWLNVAIVTALKSVDKLIFDFC